MPIQVSCNVLKNGSCIAVSAKVCILAHFGSKEQFFELIACRCHIRDTFTTKPATATCGNTKTNKNSSEICKGPETGVYKIEAAALQQWSSKGGLFITNGLGLAL